jgi:hypothetical protein
VYEVSGVFEGRFRSHVTRKGGHRRGPEQSGYERCLKLQTEFSGVANAATNWAKKGGRLHCSVVMVSTIAIAAAMYDSPHLYLHLLRITQFSGVRTAISDLLSEDMRLSMPSSRVG